MLHPSPSIRLLKVHLILIENLLGVELPIIIIEIAQLMVHPWLIHLHIEVVLWHKLGVIQIY